jgi:hypothetical protein
MHFLFSCLVFMAFLMNFIPDFKKKWTIFWSDLISVEHYYLLSKPGVTIKIWNEWSVISAFYQKVTQNPALEPR